MRRLVLAFAVVSASAVVTASALAAPPTAAQVAASTCQTFATNQPAAFAKIFSSDADCQSTLATAAQAAVDSCTGKTGDALKACVTPLMQAAVILAGDAKKAESDAKAMKVANTVAKNACQTASQKVKGFKKTFGSVRGCASKLAAAALAAAKACAAQNTPGSDAFKACVGPRISAAVKAASGK